MTNWSKLLVSLSKQYRPFLRAGEEDYGRIVASLDPATPEER